MGRNHLAPAGVVLHERDGAFVRGMAIAPHLYPEPARRLDFTRLELDEEQLVGELSAGWRTAVYNQHPERPTVASQTDFQVRVAFENEAGTANGKLTTPNPPRDPRVTAIAETRVDATRRPMVEYPDDVQFEIPVYYGHHGKQFGWLGVRFTARNGKADRGYALYRGHRIAHGAVEMDMHFDGENLRGSWTTDLNGEATTYSIEGSVIDRFVAFEATMKAGDQTWSCGGHGRINLAGRRLPESATEVHTWNVPYTAEPDPALVEEAAKVANRPLGVIEPGPSRLLWSWRLLAGFKKNKGKGAKGGVYTFANPMAAMHPPAFDLVPIPGAASYRFILNGNGEKHVFTVDRPTHSLAPAWPKMAPGEYRLRVVGLDGTGKPMPQPIRARHLEWGDVMTGPNTKVLTIAVPEDGIPITKRASFQGPYFEAPRDGYAAVLAWARYVRESQHLAGHKGLLPFPGFGSLGGDGKQNYRFMDHVTANLMVYVLSDDPEERAEALRSARHAAESGEHDTRVSPAGLVGTYKFNSNTHNVAGDAFLNLYEFDKDERWKESALRFARGLAGFQKEDGSWEWVTGGGKVYPKVEKFGSYWSIDCNPAEILSFYGRLRHELRTDEFMDVERKALAFLREWIQREFTWVEVGPHSWCWDYPLKIHSRSPQHLALYLVFYAEERDRDLALAEELALWSEDRNISWDRVAASDGQVTGPHGFGSCDGYRSSGPPASFVSRLALIYLKLYEATGKRLHLEKARALFASLLHAQHPESGYLNRKQRCVTEAADYPMYKHQLIGHTLRYLYDYETLARGLRR